MICKQIIKVLASYKFNLFHFHVTDNPGWRLVSKKYPQLNAAILLLLDDNLVSDEYDVRQNPVYPGILNYSAAKHRGNDNPKILAKNIWQNAASWF